MRGWISSNSTSMFTLVKSTSRRDMAAHEILSSTEQLMAEYPDQFRGLGKFPGTASIEVDPSIRPVVHGPKKVSYPSAR